jgi:dethiobiotin synthetase
LSALLIAATDSDTGKTVLISALAAYWQAHSGGRSLGIMKPVQSGMGDRELYQRLFPLNQSISEINPIHFDSPLAPPIAAEKEGRRISLDNAWHTFETLSKQKDWVLVEALGSLGSPITHETTVADLAWDWRIPTVLVVPVKLGAIGQAVANVALARQSRVHIKGIVLNCVAPCTQQDIDDWAPADLIQSLTQVPILGLIPHLPDPTDLGRLTQVASDLALERLMPMRG